MKTYLSTVTVALLAPLAAAGCSPNTSGSTNVTCRPLTTPQERPAAFTGSVITIVMENKSQGDIFGNPSAPFINSLAKKYAVAEGYHDPFVHPSEANYLWMVSGENFGVLDDADPVSHHLTSTSHIADQLEEAGLTWKSYQEGMGDPCGTTSHGRYAAKHNPFVFFDDVNGWDGTAFHPEIRCNAHVVDYSQIDADLANKTLPDYAFITPNLDDDMHDGSIAKGDAWLATEIPKLMASDQYKNGGTIFLMWDEGGGYPAADDPPFIAISEVAKPAFTSKADYDTSSYLATVQAMFGLESLPCADTTTAQAAALPQPMDELFTASLTPSAQPPVVPVTKP